ncbi:hypothetical protein [Bradyrhizobium shewense]|uniref:hypothetical protein n=1 Tax=Bradyrhizobium shewense TaxID=1761772 RepID=UPI0013F59DB2|nr:hypothetical protein [Bradyrhizobium shewense]
MTAQVTMIFRDGIKNSYIEVGFNLLGRPRDRTDDERLGDHSPLLSVASLKPSQVSDEFHLEQIVLGPSIRSQQYHLSQRINSATKTQDVKLLSNFGPDPSKPR